MAELTRETWDRIGKLQQRAKTDPQLRQQLEADPRRVLEAEGIPTSGLRIARHDDARSDDVAGYALSVDEKGCICVIREPFTGRCYVAVCPAA